MTATPRRFLPTSALASPRGRTSGRKNLPARTRPKPCTSTVAGPAPTRTRNGAIAMDAVINDFVQVLRSPQLRVPPAESIDALLALKHVGLGERGMVRDTLRATLIKNQEDTETFDRLFDLYFSLRPRTEKPAARLKLPDHDHGPPPDRLELGE